MNVVAHETVGPDFQGIFLAVQNKPLDILEVICLVFEDVMAIITSLSNVMGKIDRYCSGDSWHESIILKGNRGCQENGRCPHFSFHVKLF